MTDLELQHALVEELRQHLLQDGIMMIRGREFKDMNVYAQELPIREDGEEDPEGDQQWNYILVVLDDEDIVEGEWRVMVHFSVGIEDMDPMCQGHTNVAYLLNEIYQHLVKKGIIGGRFRIEEEAHKRFNQDLCYPYYEGDLITFWRLALPFEEGLGEFL